MSGVNKAILIGRVGQKPEIRRTQGGAPVATFSLATGESWRDKATGERREKTEWHQVVIFNEALVKVVEQYVDKGSKLYLEGKIKTRKFADQAGVEKYRTEIVLEAFGAQLALLDRAERSAPDPDSYGSASSRPAAPATASRRADLDDEIPF